MMSTAGSSKIQFAIYMYVYARCKCMRWRDVLLLYFEHPRIFKIEFTLVSTIPSV
jgi:hypothetical protein